MLGEDRPASSSNPRLMSPDHVSLARQLAAVDGAIERVCADLPLTWLNLVHAKSYPRLERIVLNSNS